jgi:hypothetical protein
MELPSTHLIIPITWQADGNIYAAGDLVEEVVCPSNLLVTSI